MQLAVLAKREGNRFLKAGNCADAIRRYVEGAQLVRLALDAVSGREISAEEDRLGEERDLFERVRELHEALCLNLAQAFLEENEWEKAIEAATFVLDSDPNNPKALYRRGLASFHLGTEAGLSQASEDFRQVADLRPDHVAVQEHLRASLDRLWDVQKGPCSCQHPQERSVTEDACEEKESVHSLPDCSKSLVMIGATEVPSVASLSSADEVWPVSHDAFAAWQRAVSSLQPCIDGEEICCEDLDEINELMMLMEHDSLPRLEHEFAGAQPVLVTGKLT